MALRALGALNGAADPAWYHRRRRALTEASYQKLKRILDVILSVAILPFVLLVLAGCAIAIWIDSPGPIFFAQSRTGRGGRRFRMFKLRTMVANAELMKAQYAHLSVLRYPDFKIIDDPRITRVGAFLRRTSLDELPQIFNVLRGDMSIVGPRPTSFSADTYRLWHTARLEVRPGITGLWQVCGRNELEFDDRLRLDIAYIRERCMSLDLKILFRTFSVVVGRKGA
jgi:lipopolysaccharide/colanic/teichoic acid biosynthesis glycosyltransferase